MVKGRVLRKIFGPKRESVTDERRSHNEKLHDFHFSPSIIKVIKLRRMRWLVRVAHMGEKRNAYRVLVGKLEAKRPLRTPAA
jgi:hypothetical protein